MPDVPRPAAHSCARCPDRLPILDPAVAHAARRARLTAQAAACAPAPEEKGEVTVRPAAQERSAASLNTAAGFAGRPRDRAPHLQALAVPGSCGACGLGSLGKDADAEAVARTGALSAAGVRYEGFQVGGNVLSPAESARLDELDRFTGGIKLSGGR